MKKVAITGGLSCGKTSVCRIFKELGAYVISADEIVHRLLSPNKDLGQQVIRLLGNDIIVDGKIDRTIIAQKVFNEKDLLQSLEKIIHPIVLSEIEKQYQQISDQGKTPLFIAEIPLLFEVESEKRFDITIAVWADSNVCKKRFTTATGYGSEEYEKRMANQMSAQEKARRADYVIKNSGNLKQMHQAVVDLFIKLTATNGS